ncbi:MAG: PIG-L family deacetylase [Gemmatimonadetes bacterium]|nr:PIG-L family deacetylase [Gemmatimonadota bacterium]
MRIPGLRGAYCSLAQPLLAVSLALLPAQLFAQALGPGAAAVETGLLLRQLDGEKRVLMIGAHPDDEDTAMLTALARGQGARTAYLSLTRGEGGQNGIGPELNEGLGILRTGELMSARSLDGAEQFFTRAFDFGFSKTLEDTLRHWPEDEVLRDVVWVVRTFRPQVIIAVFSGTPADGHGHHQVAGVLARRAYQAAADPAQFADQLGGGVEVWAPQKLYQLRRGGGGAAAMVVVETGHLDPLLGRSFYQVAMESRSRHRSQDMGAAQTPGPRTSGGVLVESRVASPGVADDGFYAGIDTTLAGIARGARAPREAELLQLLSEYREALRGAEQELGVLDPDPAVARLLVAPDRLRRAGELGDAAPEGSGKRELLSVLQRREELLASALIASTGVVVELRAGSDRAIPGEETELDLLVWNGGPREVMVYSAEIGLPPGSVVHGDAIQFVPPGEVGSEPSTVLYPTRLSIPSGDLRRWTFKALLPATAELSRLYFLAAPQNGDMYRWPENPSVVVHPGNPAPITARVSLRWDGSSPVVVERNANYVGVNRTTGEFRVPVYVLPRVAVALNRSSMAWPVGEAGPREISVRVSDLAGSGVDGELRLQPPSGWTVSPEQQSVRLAEGDGEAVFRFQLRPGPEVSEGVVTFRAVLSSGGREFDEGVTMIDYPHVDPTPLFQPATLEISYFPVQVAIGSRIGYVEGPGDDGLEALRDLGLEVQPLGPDELRSGPLDGFDAIVLGIRAYETRTDLAAANERILAFARQGGTVVVQYNKYEYPDGDFAPFPVTMSRPHDRVTDPNAIVTFLVPSHPALTSPNRLGEGDFRGWAHERGLYFLNRWDDRYTPLLRMADAGEAPNDGSLVVAKVGDGAYVYTGLALFRQIPEGVPGVFRILANLVSLRGSDL